MGTELTSGTRVAAALLTAVVAAAMAATVGSDADRSLEAQQVASRANELGVKLLGTTGGARKNTAICPLSVYEALALLEAGARGQTASDLREVMGTEGIDPAAGLSALHDQILGEGNAERPTVESANSVWVQSGMAAKQDYAKRVREAYAAELLSADFTERTEAARVALNAWVSGKTHDMIPELFAPGTVDWQTRLIVCNAIYLRARWEDPMDPGRTRPWRFWLSPDESVRIPFMRRVAVLPYLEEPDCMVTALPYVGGELVMVVVVPKAKDGLDRLTAGLSAARLGEWSDRLADRKILVLLPRMRLRSTVRLTDSLKQLGVRSVFDPRRADLTGVSDEKPLYLDRMLHVVAVDVDEEGTEAAAVTAGVAVSGGPKLPAIVADCPFLFLIRHRPSGAILFMARVVDPRG
jgi:serpin B